MGPVRDTTVPTVIEAVKNIFSFNACSFTPRLWASSSPEVSRSISKAKVKIKMAANMTTKPRSARRAVSKPAIEPISQCMILKESWASLRYWTNKTKLEKKKLITTPAKSMMAVDKPPLDLVIDQTKNIERPAPASAEARGPTEPVRIRATPPSQKYTEAPKEAPEETPKVKGVARGLRNRA
jgi:hypothetical protein